MTRMRTHARDAVPVPMVGEFVEISTAAFVASPEHGPKDKWVRAEVLDANHIGQVWVSPDPPYSAVPFWVHKRFWRALR